MTQSPNASPTAHRLLERLSQGQLMILLLASGVVAITLQWWSSRLETGGWKDFWEAIATGLLVSAAFGIAQAFITGRATTELLRASIISEVSRSLSVSNQEFFPTHDFAQASTPDPAFNLLINQDLRESSLFWFRGLSARYTAARLLQNRNPNLQAIVIIPDPRFPTSIEGRVHYEIRQELNPGMTHTEVHAKIMRDIQVGIVGLFEARHRCASIELVLTPMPFLDRYELFRNAIWVTLFSDRNQATKFPRTLRYSSGSVMYRMHEAECIQTRQHSTSRITNVTDESDLPTLFESVFGVPADQAELKSLAGEMKSFSEAFLKSIGSIR